MKHDKIERNLGILVILTMLAISAGGLVEIVPLFFIKGTVEKVAARVEVQSGIAVQCRWCEPAHM